MNGRGNLSQFEVISQLRFPLIVLVTYAHSYGAVAADYSLLASDWNTYEFLKLLISQTLVKVAVPVFFIISGYLFFANVDVLDSRVYFKKIRRRFWTLLVPYVVWNFLMAVKMGHIDWNAFWIYYAKAGVQIDWFGNMQLMTAPCNMPLWFLRDLIIVSLLSPIIYIGVSRWGSWLLATLTVFYLSGICAFIPGLSAYAVYFFSFGAFFGIRKINFVAVARRAELPVYVLSVCLGVAMMLTYRTTIFSSLMLCFRIVGAFAAFALASRILSATSRRLPRLVVQSSYFIYLAHYVLFLSFIDTAFFHFFGVSTAACSVHYLLCPLIKVVLLVGAYIVYDKILTLCRKER